MSTLRRNVLENLRSYLIYHIKTELGSYDEIKDGSFELVPALRDGVASHRVTSWNVSGVQEPLVECLMQYDYDDVSRQDSVINYFKKAGEPLISIFQDYKEARQALRDQYPVAGWSGYDDETKLALAKTFLASEAQIDTVMTAEEKVEASRLYHLSMKDSRSLRWTKASAYIYLAFGVVDGKTLIDHLYNISSVIEYIDGLDRLFDYFNDSGNFVLTGYSTVPVITPQDGYTKEEVKATILNIL